MGCAYSTSPCAPSTPRRDAARAGASLRLLAQRPPRIAVFDADYPSTLALVGSLARAGAPLIAYHHEARCVLRYSRYIERVHRCPDLLDYERFPVWLERQLQDGVFDLIAPTSDVVCYHLSEVMHRLPAAYQARLPTRDALLDVLFKDRFAQACARHGIATPATRAPTSLEEALADAEAIGYPLILKPRSHVCNPRERGGRVDTPEQLRAAFGPYSLPAKQQCLLQKYPQLGWPLLQEYVDHAQPQLSCSGVLNADGELIAGAATIKLDQSPSATGTGTAFASHHDDAFVRDSARAVSQLLGRGLFEIEWLRRGAGGPAMLIDVNARVFGQIGFDIARGNDLPALWYATLNGAVSAQTQPRQAVACVYPGPFLLANLTRIVTGPRRWPRLLRCIRLLARTRHCTGWNGRDPLASLVMTLRPLRHPTTFIRSHIREQHDADA